MDFRSIGTTAKAVNLPAGSSENRQICDRRWPLVNKNLKQRRGLVY